jgi:putative oxidoreductase
MTFSDLTKSLLRPASSPEESSRALFAVRVAIGFVFFVSGVVKFLFDNQGAGRFAKLGFSPGVATLVGAVEIIAGLLVTAGLFTRLAAASLAIDMVVAIATTKLPILLGSPPEPIAALPKIGFWAFAYQARLDLAMLSACVAVVMAGAGAFSLEAMFARRRSRGAMSSSELATT